MSAPKSKIIEANLGKAGAKWKWLRFFQHIGTLGATISFCVLLLGIFMQRGWVTSRMTAIGFVVLIVLGGGVAFLFIAALVASKFLSRPWLAEKVEQGEPTLLDRLNTLIFLEKQPENSSLPNRWFQKRIAKQAAAVLSKKPARIPFPARDVLIHNAVFLVLLAGTIYFFHRFDPWSQLHSNAEIQSASSGHEPGDLELPDANAVEQKKEWGEVRITDPAQDLKVTKVDAVQLQIEAAASQPLKSNVWFSAVNGSKETSHVLPAPDDPKYAVYQPVIYVDEFHLSDWDVMTYYAQARAGDGQSYGSEVYFLEVRPFREDILKMPGGEGGSAYQCLNQLTQLIDRQQHVIRQTHRFLQTPGDTQKMREQDRGKLADAEKDLSETTRHLYAEMTVKMENKPIGEVLDQLALAENTLDKASDSLRENEMPIAKNQEREALQQLIETRKIFQKTVSENPNAFDDKKEKSQDTSPIADDSKDKLKQMAEFRNEGKATKEFVKDILEKQKALATKATAARPTNYTALAKQEHDLKTQLEQFQAQHPQMFKQVTNESAQANAAMEKAAADLEKNSLYAKKQPQVAAEKLEALSQSLDEEMSSQQLSNAYKLKKLLDEQVGKLEQAEKQPDAQQLQKTAQQAKETTDQLKQTAEQKPTSDFFGPELANSLNDQKKNSLDQTLDDLAKSTSAENQKALALKAKEGLQQISKAFEQSEPQAMQQAKKTDALKDGEQNSFEKGMAQLQGLLNRLQNNKPLSPEDLEKLREETSVNLQDGLNLYGSNENSKQLLLLIEKELKDKGHPLDIEGLKKLMSELEYFSAEVKDPSKKSDDPVVTNIDPTRVPPAYRGRVERYFRKLSETK